MADFGHAGVITVRERDNAVLVNVTAGEYLYFKVTVAGAEPIFTFACKHRKRFSAKDIPGHPKQVYEWTWGKSGADIDGPDDMHGVAMLFITAVQYTIYVEHRDATDAVVNLLKDLDFRSSDPADSFVETLRIFSA